MFPDQYVATAIFHLSLLAQDDVAPEPNTFGKILENPLTPLVGLFFLFYFIFILPEKRRKTEEKNRMAALMKNDRIVTIGGIHGTIVSASPESDVVTIRIDENSNTRIKMNRSAIASIVSEKESKEANHKETVSDTKDS